MLDWTHLVAMIGLGAAALMTGLWRNAVGRLEASHVENVATRKTLKGAEGALDKEQKARRKQSEELAEFRKRADKAKRRTGKPANQPMGTASRIQDLEDAIGQATRERDRFRTERDAHAEELAKLKTRIEVEARATAEREALAASAPPAPRATEAPDPRLALEAGLAHSRERIEKLESEQRASSEVEARLRKRIETQEQLYASLRGELEVKKDRLRTQEEQLQRLQALKVAMLD